MTLRDRTISSAIAPTVSSACSIRSDQNAALRRMQFLNRSPVEKRVPGAIPILIFMASSYVITSYSIHYTKLYDTSPTDTAVDRIRFFFISRKRTGS